VEGFERRIPIAGAHRRLVEHLANVRTTAPDVAPSLERAALEGIGRDADQRSDCLRLMRPSSGNSAINVQASTGPTPGMDESNR
jgi:hypothetical protein